MATDKKTLKCNKPRRTPDHKTKSHIVRACSAGKEKIIRFYVGELPLIKNILERLGLREIFTKYIKPHKNEKIPAVDSLMILLFNITCGRQPIYELEEWVGHINPKKFGYN